MGLHRLDSLYMVIQAIIAISLGYFGGKYFGMNGILLGLLIPMIALTLIHKGYVITHFVFPNLRVYYLKNLLLILIEFIIISLVVLFLCSFIDIDIILIQILLKGIVGFVLSASFVLIFNSRNPYLQLYYNLLYTKLHLK